MSGGLWLKVHHSGRTGRSEVQSDAWPHSEFEGNLGYVSPGLKQNKTNQPTPPPSKKKKKTQGIGFYFSKWPLHGPFSKQKIWKSNSIPELRGSNGYQNVPWRLSRRTGTYPNARWLWTWVHVVFHVSSSSVTLKKKSCLFRFFSLLFFLLHPHLPFFTISQVMLPFFP